MKKLLCALIIFLLPLTGFAGLYSGKVNKINVNQKNKVLTFELESSESTSCSSAWYWIKRPNAAGASSAELVVQSYFNQGRVTVNANKDCPTSKNPAKAIEISVGVSKDEKIAEVIKFREKIGAEKIDK